MLKGSFTLAAIVFFAAGVQGAARAGEQIGVTVDPGKGNLAPWIAQQRLDLSGAMELLGRNGKPHLDSVEVWECDGDGALKERVPSQFDVESRDPLIGTVSWRTEKTDAGKLRHYRIRWSNAPAASEDWPASVLTVEQRDGLCIVSNSGYRVVHDPGRGGLVPQITYLPSGKTDSGSLWHDGLGEYELRFDREAKVEVKASGPLRAVVEVNARYLNEQGKAPPSRPRATYRFTYLAGQPQIRVEASVRQDEAHAWPALRFGDIRPDTGFFTGYWMIQFSGKKWEGLRDLKHLGSHTNSSVGVLTAEEAFLGVTGLGGLKIWDMGHTPESYIRAQLRQWHTTRANGDFYIVPSGSKEGPGLTLGVYSRFLGQPPKVVLDVTPYRAATESMTGTYREREAQLATIRGIHRVLGHFALREVRTQIADADSLMNQGLFSQVRESLLAADSAASSVRLGNQQGKTVVHRDRAVGVETDDLLILMNQDMAVAFDRTTFSLQGLYDPEVGKGYVLTSAQAPAPTVIGATLLTPDRQEVAATGLDACERAYSWRKTPTGVELVLSWHGAAAPGQPGVLDLEGRIWIESDGMARFSCRVENRSADLGLRFVKFPILGPLRAWEDDDPVDFNASGVPNPTSTGGGGLGGNYTAYYGSRGGIYVCAEDPDYRWKKDLSGTDSASRTATLGHAYYCTNSHGEQVKTFEATYPVAVGIFHGDWYTAARIYRKWAIRQPWCAKGTIAERDDLPDWFKQMDFWHQGGGAGLAGYEMDQRIAQNYGRPVGILTTTWMHFGFDDRYPDYFPPKIGPEAFQAAIAQGHELGLHYMPYINAFLYATNAPSFSDAATRAGAMYLDGTPRGITIAYGTKYMPAIAMCPSTKFWQEKISQMGGKLIQEYDVDGIYWDQVDWYQIECGDPSHGHALGGGNSWIQGVRDMLGRVRRESLAAGKKVVFTSEFWRPQYIGHIDAALAQYATNDTRGELIRDVIYHDYMLTFGYYWISRPLVPYAGGLFIAGAQGPFHICEKYLSGQTPDANALTFLHYLSDCRRQFGVKYLNLGARLRNPPITTELPLVNRGYKTQPTRAVISSAWEAGDGDIGCFFMNVSGEPQEFDYEIDLARFELYEPLGTYAVTKYELGRKTLLEEKNRGKVTGSDRVEPGKMMMIEFSRE